jgi:drug/metabolite transporter (DMT)-like permease|tara:strand:- start:400 stop:1344 length:945 start_codon:yes stop_codon:yes gene_type:complete
MTDIKAPLIRLNRLSAPVQGALYMTAAAFGMSLMNVLIREVASELHPLQTVFFRNFFALLVMLPWVARAGLQVFHTKRLKLQILRSVIGIIAMVIWFTAISLLPLAQAVALNFTVPLFATVAAVFFLGETVRARRWSATGVGFLGVLVILRPGFVDFTLAMFLPILAAVFMAISIILVKKLSDTERPASMVLYTNLLMSPISLVPALFVWTTPSWLVLGYSLVIGAVAVISHIGLTRAYRCAEASAVMPFDYARLPFIALMAYLFYGESPDLWTWVGAAIIAGSALYIAQREAKSARQGQASQAAASSPKGRHI